MLSIRIDVEVRNDLDGKVMPASEWMFPAVEAFWRKAMAYSPFWTGALQSSVALDEDVFGAGLEVTAGDPAILNPITHTPTSEYASVQEEEKHFMQEAYNISGVRQKLDAAAARVFER